jgi:hypothetical protein
MDEPKSITATFVQNYTLTYNVSGFGTIVGTNPQVVASGGDGTLVTATPTGGYAFLSWSDDYPTAARTDLDVTTDITVTANFSSDD